MTNRKIRIINTPEAVRTGRLGGRDSLREPDM
jgi:hypothetical protein